MSSTQKLPSGRWRTRLFIGKDKEGKVYTKSFTADTKRESEFLAHEYQVKNKIKNTAEVLSSTPYELCEVYIEQRKKQLSLSVLRPPGNWRSLFREASIRRILYIRPTRFSVITPSPSR